MGFQLIYYWKVNQC